LREFVRLYGPFRAPVEMGRLGLVSSAEVHESHAIRRPLAHCPDCGSARLDPVVDLATEDVHFACANCGARWRVALGYVSRVVADS
jgi:predicted RNA-binding Zn-ribbon protein involved in translation (DUF1610 family)